MPGLRPIAESDVPRVADLVWKVLHGHKSAAPPSLREYLSDLFLHNPWLDQEIVSRVYEDADGKIVAFFGAVPRRMTFQGKPIRMAFGSNFVVDPESRVSMVAVQLVKAFMKGAQDVSITDSANEGSRQLLRSLGFNVVPVYSLQWARPLRPSRYAAHALSRLKKKGSIESVARPLCAAVDGLLSSVKLSPFRQSKPTATGEDMDTEMLLGCLTKIPGKHWLLPEYTQESLDWVFRFLTKRNAFGEIHKVLVRNRDQKIIGWCIYSGAPGKVGEVLQLGAESVSASIVLDYVFYDAWKRGLIGLHGRLEPQLMQELTAKSCFFFRNGSWTLVSSNRPELLSLIHTGTAFFSRMEGEWCLRHGGGSFEE